LATCNLITVSHEWPLQDLALADMTTSSLTASTKSSD
jgi:hypothetical protein